MIQNNFPKLHNAMWPGLVGKGSPGAEPCIDLDTMLDLTAKAEVNGVKFDGVDLFLYDPHTSIDITDDGLKALADKMSAKGLQEYDAVIFNSTTGDLPIPDVDAFLAGIAGEADDGARRARIRKLFEARKAVPRD